MNILDTCADWRQVTQEEEEDNYASCNRFASNNDNETIPKETRRTAS